RGRGRMDAGTFWARHVKGDTMLLQLVRSASPVLATSAAAAGADSYFVIDEYVAGFAELSDTKAICGVDDKENAICYSSSHPTEYNTSRAVARLLIGGSGLCTGWLVSGDNHLITNEHCITSSDDAINTDYEFMAEADRCSDSNCQLCYPGDLYSGATFIKDNASLDYALVQITSGNPAGTYGFLELDNRTAVVGEEIYIPQHPGGRAKELGIFSTDALDGGLCHVNSITEAPCSGSGFFDVGYMCDTEGGSSGSPVLARSSNKVIALHHCALCENRGVPINLIYPEIAEYLGSCGDGTCNGAEDKCSCPDDCGAPPTSETSCSDGVDNDCDGDIDCDDADCTGTVDCPCDYDGTCELGEDCNNCPSDCISGSGGAVCGNGICESGDGEDCSSCPSDCNGITTGRPSGRFCCGSSSLGCSDSRCTTGGYSCTSVPAGSSFCCGDGFCEGDEDAFNCSIDCTGGSYCGDGTCDPGEDVCSCSDDCGLPPASEVPNTTCADGVDNDCDGVFDCNDADCGTDPTCNVTCGAAGDACTTGADCCSGSCHPAKNYCR
ncbi:MAG: trypsin-like peptidase domain-containing protein, partial [Thermoanaerobaculales bacterium]|nr:trypsin-like peptidase domain-containing protein [Thermoanaerobaculales bacterium]